MANDVNGNELSDKDLVVDASGLSDVCSQWSSDVLSADLGSIDVSGDFSALTSNGIGTNYISSLQNALKSSDRLAMSITSLISTAAQDQTTADQNGNNRSNTNGTVRTNYGGGGGGGYRGSNSGSSVTTSNTEADNSKADTNIKTDAENKTAKLEEGDQIKLVTALQSIIDGSIYDYLFDTNFASKVKEALLSAPNLSNDLKQKVAQMDENELQVELKSIYTSDKNISDFSKIVVTIFDSDLKANFKGATGYDSAESISKVYSYLSKQTNFQEQLKDIYLGTSQIKEVDDKVVFFTRSFVDTLATASNVSYEDILKDTKYQDALLAEIKDLSNTFSVLDAANKQGTAETLYSNLIIKE